MIFFTHPYDTFNLRCDIITGLLWFYSTIRWNCIYDTDNHIRDIINCIYDKDHEIRDIIHDICDTNHGIS